jgi:hypothetical protein
MFNVPTLRKGLMVAVALVLLGITRHWYHQYQQSDAAQQSKFHARRVDYEVLLRMLHRDKHLTFINTALTTPTDPGVIGISPQQIVEYRRIMSKIDCGAISYTPAIDTALFSSARDNLYDPDILYAPQLAAIQVGSSSVKMPDAPHHIEENWFWAWDWD